MSNQNNGTLSDKEKIDRAAWHEEVRFLKRQQWAVTTAGLALLGAFLATLGNAGLRPCEKALAVLFIMVGICAGGYFLDDLQDGLATTRKSLDPKDPNPKTRGGDILLLHKLILVGGALVVVWVLLR